MDSIVYHGLGNNGVCVHHELAVCASLSLLLLLGSAPVLRVMMGLTMSGMRLGPWLGCVSSVE